MNRLHEIATQLVAVIDRLQSQDRAGITPTQGQVFELFDLKNDLKHALLVHEPPVPCSIPSCGRPATVTVHEQRYCARCGRAMSLVTTQVTGEAPEIARNRIQHMLMGRAPWPNGVDATEPVGTR
ncbi:MAG TPA: hypothetical protein VFA59_17980 [Vicinamibacterales bacterium]|nr:hypothetical protein [Vicinamibacterales bacterium]